MNSQSFKETILQALWKPTVDQNIADRRLDEASDKRIAQIDIELAEIDKQLQATPRKKVLGNS